MSQDTGGDYERASNNSAAQEANIIFFLILHYLTTVPQEIKPRAMLIFLTPIIIPRTATTLQTFEINNNYKEVIQPKEIIKYYKDISFLI